MRPVDRGVSPVPRGRFNKYRDAFAKLEERLGEYCSYCERRIESNLAVEHIKPKEEYKRLEIFWYNYLLACTSCNSCKSHGSLNLDDYLWPYRDNTYLAFNYDRSGRLQPNPLINKPIQQKATATLKLLGLHKLIPDKRARKRKEIYGLATKQLNRLVLNDTADIRESIVEIMTGRGGWSIWVHVFKDRPDMVKLFIDAIPGTSTECFDATTTPIKRNNGQI